MKAGLGIDIGGTNTKIIVLREGGKVLNEIRFKTTSEEGYPLFVRTLSDKVKELKKNLSGVKISGAGIGMAGDIDSERGVLRFSPNLSGWRNKKLASDLKKITGLDYVMENDANMAAWGAYRLELNKEAKNVLVATLGTGIGGGIISGGTLYHGYTGTAGEIGHVVIEPGGQLCKCGNRGCLEAYCGSGAIVRRALSLIKNEKKFREKYGFGPEKKINTVALSRAAADGEPAALETWEKTGYYLGLGFGGMILVLNPEYLILTGGVSKGASYFLPSMKKTLEQFRIRTPFEKLKIKVSDNPDLGSYGAAFYGLELGA